MLQIPCWPAPLCPFVCMWSRPRREWCRWCRELLHSARYSTSRYTGTSPSRVAKRFASIHKCTVKDGSHQENESSGSWLPDGQKAERALRSGAGAAICLESGHHPIIQHQIRHQQDKPGFSYVLMLTSIFTLYKYILSTACT